MKTMTNEQEWQTESYKGFDVHVTALPHETPDRLWDYAVRVAYPGDDATAESEITARSEDDEDFESAHAAVEAGFIKGYTIVDALFE
jgi:hypothetical protein